MEMVSGGIIELFIMPKPHLGIILNMLLLSRIKFLVKGLPLFVCEDKKKVWNMLWLHTTLFSAVHLA